MLFIREENCGGPPAATKTDPISRVYEGWIRPISSGYAILSFHANLNAARMRFPMLLNLTYVYYAIMWHCLHLQLVVFA